MIKEVDIYVRKVFNGRNMKNTSLISIVTNPLEVMDRNTVASRSIPVDDYPIFITEDPPEILEAYITYCLATCITLVAYLLDKLPGHPLDVLSLNRKRKSKKMGDGPYGIVKSPAKVTKTSRVIKRNMGMSPEVKRISSKNTKQVEVSLA